MGASWIIAAAVVASKLQARQRPHDCDCAFARSHTCRPNNDDNTYCFTVCCNALQQLPQRHRVMFQNRGCNHGPVAWIRLERRKSTRLPGRVMTIVAGSLRGTPSSWESIVRLLIRPQRSQLMLVIPQPLATLLTARVLGGEVAKFNSSLGAAAYIVAVPEFDDWGDAFDLMEARAREEHNGRRLPASRRASSGWRARPIHCSGRNQKGAKVIPSALGGVRNLSCFHRGNRHVHRGPTAPVVQPSMGSAAIVGVYRWYAKRAIVQHGLLHLFDWFVFARTDVFLLCALQMPGHDTLMAGLKQSMVIIPDGEDWSGLSDRFFVSSQGAILAALTTIEHWVLGSEPLAPNPEIQMLWSAAKACAHIVRMQRTAMVVQPWSASSSTLEKVRSNFGGCLHHSNIADIKKFQLPNRTVDQATPPALLVELQGRGFCPKYWTEWLLAQRTCTYGGRWPIQARKRLKGNRTQRRL